MGERLALGDVFAFIIKSGLGWDLRGKKMKMEIRVVKNGSWNQLKPSKFNESKETHHFQIHIHAVQIRATVKNYLNTKRMKNKEKVIFFQLGSSFPKLLNFRFSFDLNFKNRSNKFRKSL